MPWLSTLSDATCVIWRQKAAAGELFNAFNNVNYEPPANTVGSAGFGTITSARPGRNVQLGLKFYW